MRNIVVDYARENNKLSVNDDDDDNVVVKDRNFSYLNETEKGLSGGETRHHNVQSSRERIDCCFSLLDELCGNVVINESDLISTAATTSSASFTNEREVNHHQPIQNGYRYLFNPHSAGNDAARLRSDVCRVYDANNGKINCTDYYMEPAPDAWGVVTCFDIWNETTGRRTAKDEKLINSASSSTDDGSRPKWNLPVKQVSYVLLLL